MEGFPTDAIGWISALMLGVLGAIREVKRRQGVIPPQKDPPQQTTASLPAEPIIKTPTAELGEEGQTRLLFKILRKIQHVENKLGDIHQATGDIQDRVAANQTSIKHILKKVENDEDQD